MIGIIVSKVVAVRQDPNCWSRMETQAFFGELFSLLDEDDCFVKIKLDYDGEIGWVDKKNTAMLGESECRTLMESPRVIIDKSTELHCSNSPFALMLLPGSEVRFNGKQGNQMCVGSVTYSIKQRLSTPIFGNPRTLITSLATGFVHSPCLSGGLTHCGIDASGFTQVVGKIAGISLPRRLCHQIAVGRTLKSIDESLPGDFAFFSDASGMIAQVGIILENQRVIHAWGQVRVDYFDEIGIYDQLNNSYTHKLMFVKNVVELIE